MVLEDISLSVEAGTWLGILGRTGSGKSTLVKTLPRLIEAGEGTVFVKGRDVRDWDLQELRKLFGFTPQDSYLFSDSIKNNIGYGITSGAADSEQAQLDEARLKTAAALSAIDQDLPSFSAGWETIIGERGLTLSGGQKQRVAIARALLAEADFLVLDDSLSAVDAETEKRILGGILEARRGKTTLIISHRISTLSNADKVLVLDAGRMLEYGTPAELAAGSGFVAKTAALQQLEASPR
jgi:ATP-binding cassette subfamily B protein